MMEGLGDIQGGFGLKLESGASLKGEKWRHSEIATIIFGVLRLGEKDFTDIMNQTIFMRRQIELEQRPQNKQVLVSLLNKSKTPKQVFEMWQRIKALRNLDLARLQQECLTQGKNIVTERDWMIAALLALTSQSPLHVHDSKRSIKEEVAEAEPPIMHSKSKENCGAQDEEMKIEEKLTVEETGEINEKGAESAPTLVGQELQGK